MTSLGNLLKWADSHQEDVKRLTIDSINEMLLKEELTPPFLERSTLCKPVYYSATCTLELLLKSLSKHEMVFLKDSGINYSIFGAFEDQLQITKRSACVVMEDWTDPKPFIVKSNVESIIKMDDSNRYREIGAMLQICLPNNSFDQLRSLIIEKAKNSQISLKLVPEFLENVNLVRDVTFGEGVQNNNNQESILEENGDELNHVDQVEKCIGEYARSTVIIRCCEWLVSIIFSPLDGEPPEGPPPNPYSLLKRQVNPLSLVVNSLVETKNPRDSAKLEGLEIQKWAIAQNELRWPGLYKDVRSVNLSYYGSHLENVEEQIDAYLESIEIDKNLLIILAKEVYEVPDDQKKKKYDERNGLEIVRIRNMYVVVDRLIACKRFDKALELYQELLLFDAEENKRHNYIKEYTRDLMFAACLYQIADKTNELNKKHAIECILIILDLNQERANKNPGEFHWEYLTLAKLRSDIGDWVGAEKTYYEILSRVIPRMQQKLDVGAIYKDLATVQFHMGQFKNAANTMNDALEYNRLTRPKFCIENSQYLRFLAQIHRSAHLSLELLQSEAERQINDILEVVAEVDGSGEGESPNDGEGPVKENECEGLSAHSYEEEYEEVEDEYDDEDSDDEKVSLVSTQGLFRFLEAELEKFPSHMNPPQFRPYPNHLPENYMHTLNRITDMKNFNKACWEKCTWNATEVVKQLAHFEMWSKRVEELVRDFDAEEESLKYLATDSPDFKKRMLAHADTAYHIGWIYKQLAIQDESLEKFKTALELRLKVGPPDNMALLNLDELAHEYINQSHFPEAIVLFAKAAEFFENLKQDEFVGKALYNQARATQYKGDIVGAGILYEQSAAKFPENSEQRLVVLQSLFHCLSLSSDLEKATNCGKEIISNSKIQSKQDCQFRFDFCRILVKVKQLEEAQLICSETCDILRSLVDPRTLEYVPALEIQVEIYLALEDLLKAIEICRTALAIFNTQGGDVWKFYCDTLLPILLKRAELEEDDMDDLLDEVITVCEETLRAHLQIVNPNLSAAHFRASVFKSLGHALFMKKLLLPAYEAYGQAFSILSSIYNGDVAHPLLAQLCDEMDYVRDVMEMEQADDLNETDTLGNEEFREAAEDTLEQEEEGEEDDVEEYDDRDDNDEAYDNDEDDDAPYENEEIEEHVKVLPSVETIEGTVIVKDSTYPNEKRSLAELVSDLSISQVEPDQSHKKNGLLSSSS